MSGTESHFAAIDCGEMPEPVLSGGWLGMSDDDISGLTSHRWVPFPSSLVRLLRDIWSAPRTSAKQAALLDRRERSLLALPLLAIGERMPAPEPDEGFIEAFDLVAADVRKMLSKVESGEEKRRRALARMRDAEERTVRLCEDRDLKRWEKEVRRVGIRRYLPVLEKAEFMKRNGVPDKDGNPIRCWSAYFAEMLRDAAESKSGMNNDENEKD